MIFLHWYWYIWVYILSIWRFRHAHFNVGFLIQSHGTACAFLQWSKFSTNKKLSFRSSFSLLNRRMYINWPTSAISHVVSFQFNWIRPCLNTSSKRKMVQWFKWKGIFKCDFGETLLLIFWVRTKTTNSQFCVRSLSVVCVCVVQFYRTRVLTYN